MKDALIGGVCAPVVLLFFNRPLLTARTMEAIAVARPSRLFLVQDGPRHDVESDRVACDDARRVAEAIDWPCTVHKIYADHNLGLRARVASGLNQVFQQVDRAIIVEDDCVADPTFFRFATEMLDRYADDDRVGTVSGNNFLRGRRVTPDSYFFSPDVRIWGWATWRRVWQDFAEVGLDATWSEAEARDVLERIPSATRRRSIATMASQSHSINSWAVPFVLHAQKRRYLSVVPEVNLVTNVGFGQGSTHTRFESFTDGIPAQSIDFPLRHPAAVEPNADAGRLETRLQRRLWWTFPLFHPLDFAGRIVRYLRA